jgi:hypothetical protein
MNTEYLERCISTLEKAFNALQGMAHDDAVYDIYRAACVKEFVKSSLSRLASC